MNLKEIRDELLAQAGRNVTLANELTTLMGEVKEAAEIKPGDTVRCVGFTSEACGAQKRCFTVGQVYTVGNLLNSYVGFRVVEDDEGDGHDAIGVLFERA